ncbi:MAG: hypothetical protein ACE5H2_07330 [Terriglobia bacterium]
MNMGTVSLILDGKSYGIRHLGDELHHQLLRLYDHFMHGSAFDATSFRTAVDQYFAAHAMDFTAHDYYFNAFAPLWLFFHNRTNFVAAERVWRFVLDPVLEWERTTGGRTHKGTPYYFWAVTVLVAGDVERGFLLMHRAFYEDVKTTGQPIPDRPGNDFVTLNYQKQKQFFGQHVLEIANYLEGFLESYRKDRSHNLTLEDLRNKFLANADLRPAALFFVYLIHKLYAFDRRANEGLASSDFAGLLELDFLFGLCLVTDELVKKKHHLAKASFIQLAEHLSTSAGCSLNNAMLGKINKEVLNDFGKAVSNLLQGSICGFSLQPMEADIALSYGIRNRGAHNIEGHKIVYSNFAQITQRVLNALFLSIETLY